MEYLEISEVNIQSGKPTHAKYGLISFEEIVGKTIEATGFICVEGAFSHEMGIQLLFSDGTTHGFVVPSDDED